MMSRMFAASLLALGVVASSASAAPRNVVMFVADGLRPGMVNDQNTPAMAALMRAGVRFNNTHSMFPTFTTANASALSTGHSLGDTGDFSNTIYTGFPVQAAKGSVLPFLEDDAVLGEVDGHFGGDYFHQETVMAAARKAGLSTAAIGKLGPILIFDHTDRSGEGTIIIDDSTGKPSGIPLSPAVRERLTAAGLPAETPARGANGKSGDMNTPGTLEANRAQQDYFVDVTSKVILPLFKERGKPFMLVFWSRDPDGTQHAQGDSLNHLVPGINGPTSLAAIKNADHDLEALLASLKDLDLESSTDVIVTSDHGFSTISKESTGSFAASQSYPDTVAGFLPQGFLAIDLAHDLGLKVFDPDAGYREVASDIHPARGNALIGSDKDHAQIAVAANGGSDLIYILSGGSDLASKVAESLARKDYTSGIFVADAFGRLPGTLPLSSISLKGAAITPTPSLVVNFRTFSTGCGTPLTCGASVADTAFQQGQGMHGSFSRADTSTVGGAMGPDFKTGFVDDAPTSNADIGRTVAHLLGLKIADAGQLAGRVLMEAMPGGALPEWKTSMEASEPDKLGQRTILQVQSVDAVRYFDAAGYPGRTLGLKAE